MASSAPSTAGCLAGWWRNHLWKKAQMTPSMPNPSNMRCQRFAGRDGWRSTAELALERAPEPATTRVASFVARRTLR